ncbi:WCX domain-containing protein [Anabaena azotica]|uniref:WYL domain-containing protein n=1 Tax=Anabaena azotica FACHB-119 TaxID=947527 RepID=A0ABR8DBF2_9NOST|nr:WYL domain-containing protein [Anabaena azotica]MBD2503959.1 WYL domain-containing protein [Anabaena azotica FACHB-119]
MESQSQKGGERYSIIVNQNLKSPLEKLAQEFGYLWGEKGNVKGFVEAIAQNQVPLMKSPANKSLPRRCCIYLGVDEFGEILYIGKSQNLSALHRQKTAQQLIEAGVVGVCWLAVERDRLDELHLNLVGLLDPQLNKNIIDIEVKYDSHNEVEHLMQAFWSLWDLGLIEQSRTIADILLQRYEISPALEQHLKSIPQNCYPSFSELIGTKQPFTLSYESASGNGYSFDITYAEIRQIERHHYLCCWAQQNTGKAEIPALAHNMTLRLDRVKDAVLLPISGMQWREQGLDSVVLEMKLLGRWTSAYEPKPEDISIDKCEDGIIVKRKLQFWHWAKRDILRYGSGCVVLSPEDVKGLMANETARMSASYGG